MSTDKNDKSPQRKSLRKLSKLGSRKPADAPKRVIEQVPNWLVQLLSKYGEAPGPLIGLEDPSFTHNISSDDLDEEAAQISALLEQMEEEGLPEDINQRASTSVEWGQYDDEPELPPGPLDDLLDSLGHDEDDYFQETADQDDDDWLTGSVIQPLEPEGDQDETFLSQTEAEQPDWLNDLLPADEAKPALQATFSDSEDSIPDWLNDALEAPATFDAEETVSAAEFPTETAADYQIPDWLTDALDHPTEPPGAPTQPPPPSSVADDEVEVPDWLTGVLDEPAVPPEPLQDTDSVDDDDIPDWLSQSAEQSVAAEASKIPPIEPSPDNVPDWLAENTTPDTPSAASQQLEADTDTPDWMRDLRDEAAPGTDIPDWLTSDDTSATPPSPKPQAAATDDIPDWLASDIESEVSEQTTITQAAAFDWLSDLRDSVDEDSPESDAFLSDTDLEEWPDEEPDDDMAAAAIDNRLDWLAEMDKPAAAATPAEPSMEHSVPLGTGWLRDLEPPSGLEQEPDSAPSFETAEAADTDWLDELEAPSTPETKAETETERSTPPGTGWLRDLEPPPGSQAETEIESSAERSVPAGTGWLQDLEPPPDSETRASETIGETGLETEDDDDWLAALSESSSPEAELPWTMTEEDDLDNFSETIEPDEPAEQASDVDALSFLFSDETDEAAAELVTSGQEAEGEIPDWLLAVSAEGNTDEGNTDPEAAWEEDWEDMDEDQDPDEEPETPDWLTNVRATSFPPVEVDEDELPDWLKEAPDDSPDSLDDEPAETLIPDWLRETPGIEEADDDASVYFTQDDEAEPSLTGADTSAIPDWLGSDPGEVPDWLSDDVSDIPDWLAESDAPESGVSPAGTQEAELEPSDWLMDLPDPLQTTTSTALEDQDLPAWLVDLPQESSPEAAENIVSEAPDWLSSLTPVEEMPSAPTAISTKPIEPSDEFEDLDFEDRLAALDLETEADLPEMSSDDQPKPAWLTEMLADDDTYPTAEDFPDIPAVDRSSSVDVPTPPTEPPAHDWLTGLRQVAEQASDIDIAEAEEDAETTDWDYNRSEITSPEMGELDADAGMPDWLSRLRGTPPFPTDSSDEDLDPTDQLADHSPAAEIETAEPDLPDWLADQPAPDTLEPVDDHTDEEDDLPDWLSELPTAAEVETAETEVEPNLPDWLADQPATDTLVPAAEQANEEENLPHWLSDQPEPDALEPADDHTDEEEDLPDWLSELPTAAEIETAETEVEPNLPDWLADQPATDALEPTAEQADEEEDLPNGLSERSTATKIETAETDVEPDLPDWLADQPTPDTLEPVDDHTDEEDDLPDWLSELPTAAEIETAEMEVEPDLPDWLADQPAPDTLESADDHTDEEEDLPDWLSELPTAIKIGTDETEVEPDLPGWLAAQPAPDTLEPTADHIDEEEDLPDWLSDQSTAEIETSDIDVEPDLPDWLADQTTADISEPGVESAAEGDMPDWLAGLRTSAEIEPSEMDTKSDLPDLPDWLADHPTPDTLEPAAEHIDEDEDLPDWLTDQPTPDTLEPAAEHIDEDEDLPDWLVDQPTAAEIEIAETEIEPDLPDWLADHPTPDTLEPAAEHADEDEDLPDWLVDQPTAAEIETAETEVEPGLPDWLADHPTPDTLEPSPELADEEEDLPDWLVDQPTAAEIETTETEVEPGLPDWLSGLRTATEIEPAETEVEPSTEHADEEEDLPDWLVDQPAAAEIETIEDDIEPDLPDWLSDQPVAETLVPTDEHTDEDEDLPDWLTELPTAAEIETAEADMELDLLGGLADYSLSEISDPKPIQPINELADEDDEADLSAWFSGLSAPSIPTTSDTEPNLDMPDWFADLVEIADTEPLVTKTDEAESPTWLDDLPEAGPIETSLTDDDEDLPDWLTGLRGAAETQTPETAIEPNLTDWPAEESETPQPELDTADGDDDLVMPAWLADHPVLDTPQSETSQRASDASDDDLTMPDWLMDLPEPPEVEQAAAQRQPIDELAPPTWLSSPLYAADEAKESLSAQELETPPQTPSETADDDVPVWLAVLRETKGRNVNPNELRYNYESSDVEIPTAFDEEADESRSTIPSPTAQSALTADPDTLLEAPALDTPDDLAPPDWLSESIDDSVEPEPPEPPRHTFAADTDLDMPAWLTDLSASEASSEPDTDSADLDMPFWLADQPSTDEADDNTDLDAPAWLTDLSASEDTAAAATDDDLPMPAWLADQPSTDEADDNTDLDAPAWLTDLSDREDAPEPDTGNADLPIPTWLADQAPADEADDDTDLDAPDWLADLSASEASSEPDTDSADDLPMPAWLADQADDTVEPEADELIPSSLDDDSEAPNWLAGEIETEALEADEIATGQPEISEIETEAPEADEATIVLPETEKPEAVDTISEDSGEDLVMPDWLFKGSLEELDTPEWLQDLPDIDQPAEETSSVWMTDLPELADEDDAESAVSGSYTTASERLGLVVPDQEPAPPPPEKSEPLPETPPEEPVALSGAPTESAGNLSGWLDALRTGEKTALEDDDYQIAETTGMLAGLGGLMPAESLFTPTTKKPDDDLDLAAQKFYEIATQPPQPAALPAPLSRRAQFAGRTLRAVLLLIFIGLIALPLLPATHKVVNGSTVPWTEPTDNFSAVLDEQRHQMISEQLGIVDVQQPGSVALVSFDYSLATQGEMQPLAQAVLGRLAGQGMRIIAVSLEPEGAPIAQQTIETILADRHQSDQYGQDMINLGYLPGQVAAVRAIANGRAFSTLTDYTSGEPFGGQTQADWRQIETIEQIDLVVTLADNPTSARWWIEQLATTPQGNQRSLLAATSAVANPFLRPYRQSEQLDGLISGVEGAAAVEAVRNNFGPARRMLDSQSLAHLIIIILIAVGTMVGWMPQDAPAPRKEEKLKPDASSSPEPPPAQNEPLPEDEDELEFQE